MSSINAFSSSLFSIVKQYSIILILSIYSHFNRDASVSRCIAHHYQSRRNNSFACVQHIQTAVAHPGNVRSRMISHPVRSAVQATHCVQRVRRRTDKYYPLVTRTAPPGLADEEMQQRRPPPAVVIHERAERLHEEIRPQSSTGFMTLTRSFCLHKHEREDNGPYTPRSRSSNESPIKPPQRLCRGASCDRPYSRRVDIN